jgi:YVTN family beta-propeller protein
MGKNRLGLARQAVTALRKIATELRSATTNGCTARTPDRGSAVGAGHVRVAASTPDGGPIRRPHGGRTRDQHGETVTNFGTPVERAPVAGVGRRVWTARVRSRVAALIALGALAASLVVAGAGPAWAGGTTYTVTATVTVGNYPAEVGDAAGVGVDPTSDTVYVANPSSSTVSVMNGATNTVTATVTVGNGPFAAVGVDPTTDTVYVANIDDNTVSVINGATNTVTATVTVGNEPDAVGVDPTTDTVYVANPTPSTWPTCKTTPCR